MNLIGQTNRIRLKELDPHVDAGFMLSLLNSESWIKYIGDRGVRTNEQAKTYILDRMVTSYTDNGYGLWLVSLHDETSIGICGLVNREMLAYPDLGFGFLAQYQGMGYGYESSKLVMNLARTTFGLGIVQAITLESNLASIQLLKKLGFIEKSTIIYPDDGEELLLFENRHQ